MSIIPLFLELLPFFLILLKPPLMFEYHPRDLLIDYVLAGPRHHLRDAHVADVRDHGQRRDHPEVPHVHALTVEGKFQALAVDRHYHQAVEHVYEVGDHR